MAIVWPFVAWCLQARIVSMAKKKQPQEDNVRGKKRDAEGNIKQQDSKIKKKPVKKSAEEMVLRRLPAWETKEFILLTCNPGIEPIQVLMFHQPDQDPTIELLLVHELCNQEALVKYDPAAKNFLS